MQIYPRPWSIGGKCLFLSLLIGAIILVEWLHRKSTTSNLIAEESRDNNGTPDKDGWARAMQNMRIREAYQASEAAARRVATLAKYDLNHDGRLDDDELYESLVDLNRMPPTTDYSEVRRRIFLPIISGTPLTSDKRQDTITEKPEKRRRVVLPTNPDPPSNP